MLEGARQGSVVKFLISQCELQNDGAELDVQGPPAKKSKTEGEAKAEELYGGSMDEV